MSEVIIVGAGPVGLWTAIQLKLHHPSLKILMLEKYPEYKRKHTVKIDSSSFEGAHPNLEFQQLIKGFAGLVSTKEIEQKLKNYAKKLGVDIKYEAVESCKDLEKKYPNANIIIGADGSHSVVRKEIFEDKIDNKNLQYVVELKYEVKNKTRHFSLWSEVYNPLMKVNHLVTEHIGKPTQEGNTPVTLRICVDEPTFNSMKNATFKSPYHWNAQDKQKMDPKLVQTIDIWLKEREKLFKDNIASNINISSLALNAYNSEKVVHQQNGKQWILVGDAAFGVPYYRSLNNGFLCANQLAQKIPQFINNKKEVQKESFLLFSWNKEICPLQSYSNYVSKLSQYETFIANLKTHGINALRTKLSAARTLLGMGIVGNQEEANVPKRMMMVGTAVAGSLLIYNLYKKCSNKQPEAVCEQKSSRFAFKNNYQGART